MSRIIGQCNIADFKSIEHLALTLENPEMLDPSTLSRKQKLALVVIAAFKEAGIKFQETYKIRVILFWDDGHAEFKFLKGARELMMKLNESKVRADMARGIRNMLG
ncbi:hypothetical protein ES703_82764 [subsurface metagenome]